MGVEIVYPDRWRMPTVSIQMLAAGIRHRSCFAGAVSMGLGNSAEILAFVRISSGLLAPLC